MEFFEKDHVKARILAISLSFLIGTALMAAKFYAYRLTHSSAIFSDALESIINVVASAFALGSILFAARPPDESHPYGHGKIEYFSAGFEGSLIILAALGIFWSGLSHIISPMHLPNLDDGLLILFGAGMINLVLGVWLLRAGRRTSSPAIVADGKHVLTDVYTSVGVLLGLLLVRMTGWCWLDGVIACLVGVSILVTGGKLILQAFAGLMDTAEPEILEEISVLLAKHRKDIWIDIHQLRAWRSGGSVLIDLHMILPRDFTLKEAHREAEELEQIVVSYFKGRASVLVHMDPCVDPECPICARHLCELRSEGFKGRITWNRERLTLQRGLEHAAEKV